MQDDQWWGWSNTWVQSLALHVVPQVPRSDSYVQSQAKTLSATRLTKAKEKPECVQGGSGSPASFVYPVLHPSPLPVFRLSSPLPLSRPVQITQLLRASLLLPMPSHVLWSWPRPLLPSHKSLGASSRMTTTKTMSRSSHSQSPQMPTCTS